MRKNPISKLEAEKIEYLLEDIKNETLILNHPLQRYRGMWGVEQKSNLIRRTLHDGKFLPILICTQYDEHGCEVKYLIDGVQRITTFDDFINDKFSISKNTMDYMVTYDGVLYEEKNLKSGKFSLKRDRHKNLIPILDEDGKIQRRSQTIDIRGLKYSDLPPELQEKINRYLVSVQYKLECTDEDIQIEILDYNNGTKMNDAQVGKNRLGTKFATIVTDLSNHSFIKNKCGFTYDNRTKGVIDRAINEALMLVNFGTDEWASSHKDLCRRLANRLTVEHTNRLEEMFNDLDSIIEEDEEIKDCLTLKEFFVVMANYKHFLDTDYKKECYSMFLNDFVKRLSLVKDIPTGEVDEDGNDVYGSFRTVYMTGTKQKGSIDERLSKMNEMLDTYLDEHCEGMFEEDEEIETSEFTIESDNEKIQEFANSFVSDKIAMQSLLLVTDDFPYVNFENDTLEKLVTHYQKGDSNQVLNDCLFYKSFVQDAGIREDDINMPFYIYAVKYIYTTGDDIDIDEWLSIFKENSFDDIDSDETSNPASNRTIVLKQSKIIQSIQNYNKKEISEV